MTWTAAQRAAAYKARYGEETDTYTWVKVADAILAAVGQAGESHIQHAEGMLTRAETVAGPELFPGHRDALIEAAKVHVMIAQAEASRDQVKWHNEGYQAGFEKGKELGRSMERVSTSTWRDAYEQGANDEAASQEVSTEDQAERLLDEAWTLLGKVMSGYGPGADNWNNEKRAFRERYNAYLANRHRRRPRQ